MSGTLQNLQHRLEKIGDGIREAVQKKKKEPVFGRHIDLFVDSELLEGVPIPVYRCIEHICKNGHLDESGLFRIAAVQSEVRNVRALYDKGLDPDLSETAPDPHISTNLLKMYFRELPEPLLTYELYDCFIAANTIPVQQSRLECIKKIIGFLPPRNYTLLVYLVKFLIIVSSHSDTNKMNSSNLATVFAPNLLKSQSDSVQTTIEDQPHASSMMQTMIDDFVFLFEEVQHETFDFEYYAKGESPPSPALPASPKPSEEKEKDKKVRQSAMVFPTQPPHPPIYTSRTLPESPTPPATLPYVAHSSMYKKPSEKRPPPPKPPRKETEKLEEEDDEEENRVQVRVMKRPPMRPLTIVDSPPVRSPNREEVEKLTEEFTRLSQHLSAEFTVPTTGPPKFKPPMPPKPASRSAPPSAVPLLSSPPIKATINQFEQSTPPTNSSHEQVSELKLRQPSTNQRKIDNKNFLHSEGVVLGSVGGRK